MLWAGGPGHGHTISLRAEFTDALEKYKDSLTKTHIAQLQALNLITPPKKGLLDTLLGR